jgi:hypothetical protein
MKVPILWYERLMAYLNLKFFPSFMLLLCCNDKEIATVKHTGRRVCVYVSTFSDGIYTKQKNSLAKLMADEEILISHGVRELV